jgi:hypothetical protein
MFTFFSRELLQCLTAHQCLSKSVESVSGSFIGYYTLTVSVAQGTDLPDRLYRDTDCAQRNGNRAPFRVRTWVRAHIHSGTLFYLDCVLFPTDW